MQTVKNSLRIRLTLAVFALFLAFSSLACTQTGGGTVISDTMIKGNAVQAAQKAIVCSDPNNNMGEYCRP